MRTMNVAFGIFAILLLSITAMTVADSDSTDAAGESIGSIYYDGISGELVLEETGLDGSRVTVVITGDVSSQTGGIAADGRIVCDAGTDLTTGTWVLKIKEFGGDFETSRSIDVCRITMNDGNGNSTTFVAGGDYPLESPEHYGIAVTEGKTFEGWLCDGATYDIGDSVTVAADNESYEMTITAQWSGSGQTSEVETVTITADDMTEGGQQTITADVDPSDAVIESVDWDVDGLEILSGQGTLSITVSADGEGTATVKVTVNGVESNTVTITVSGSGEEPSAHDITVTADPADGGNPSASATSAQAGEEITLSSNPAEGYEFVQWRVTSGGVTITGDSFEMPDVDVTIVAEYRLKEYAVTLVDSEGQTVDTVTVSHGSDAVLEFTAPEGMKIGTVTPGEGVVIDGKRSGTVTVPDVISEMTLTVSYVPLEKYSVTVVVEGNGTVTPGTDVVAVEYTPLVLSYEAGQDNLTVSVGIDQEGARYTVSNGQITITGISGDCTVTIEFVRGYMVTVTEGDHGEVVPGTGLQAENTSVTYTVRPDAGYAVDRVLVDGQEVEVVDNEFQVQIGTSSHTIIVEYVYVGVIDDDDDYIPPDITVVTGDDDDSTTYIVAIAAAAVVAILKS